MGEADIALRHVTRQHPEALARALVKTALPIEVTGWVDTQVTALERRLDKALELTIGGARRLLHVEFQLELDDGVPYRVFEYQTLLVMGLHESTQRSGPPFVESVVIVLRGRAAPWPTRAAFRTAWPESEFSGVSYRIEPVYQQTVAELAAQGTVLWLVFTPLARDATAAALREVIETIRERVPVAEERAELYVAMLVMAEIDPWGHNLREELRAMIDTADDDMKMIMASQTLREAFERGSAQGVEQIAEKLLRRLFTRRIGRVLTPREQESLAQRARTLGPEHVEDIALDLEGDALAAWLLDPAAK